MNNSKLKTLCQRLVGGKIGAIEFMHTLNVPDNVRDQINRLMEFPADIHQRVRLQDLSWPNTEVEAEINMEDDPEPKSGKPQLLTNEERNIEFFDKLARHLYDPNEVSDGSEELRSCLWLSSEDVEAPKSLIIKTTDSDIFQRLQRKLLNSGLAVDPQASYYRVIVSDALLADLGLSVPPLSRRSAEAFYDEKLQYFMYGEQGNGVEHLHDDWAPITTSTAVVDQTQMVFYEFLSRDVALHFLHKLESLFSRGQGLPNSRVVPLNGTHRVFVPLFVLAKLDMVPTNLMRVNE